MFDNIIFVWRITDLSIYAKKISEEITQIVDIIAIRISKNVYHFFGR